MNKNLILLLLFCCIKGKAFSQSFAINATGAAADASAMLDVASTSKGLLVPRLTTAQRTAIASPATGLMVYDNTLQQFYYYNGTAWVAIAYGGNANNYWTLSGGNLYNNAGTYLGIGVTTPAAHLDIMGAGSNSNSLQLRSGNTAITTSNNQILFGYSNSSNYRHAIKTRHNSGGATGNAIDFYLWDYANDPIINVGTKHVMTLDANGFVGIGTTSPSDKLHVVGSARIDGGRLDFRSTGYSVFVGEEAGINDDLTTKFNVYAGAFAGRRNTSGSQNTGIGAGALEGSVTGSNNTGVGRLAGLNLNSGGFNTYLGASAGYSNVSGSFNVFLGYMAGFAETGSNKLYIANSNTATPLIYGDFSTKKITINDSLQSKYFKMTNAASNGYVLQSDANGNGSWVNSNTLTVSETDPQVAAAATNMVPKWNGTALADGIIYDNGSNIGIGTTTPTQAKLVVNGSVGNTFSYGYLNGSGATGTITNGTANYSIYASQRIAASEFNAYSDARIKNIKGISDGHNDLQTLMGIEITDYRLKDFIGKGNRDYKKAIAQQVEKVYPQAVSKMTDVVPDIYQAADMKNGTLQLSNTLKAGDKVKLIFETGEEMATVTGATANAFTVDVKRSGKVFVFGREVSDFRSVDYEAISMLNVSATQELAKQVKEQKETISKQQQQINELMNELKKLKQPLPVSLGGAL